jgi:hypothetical protein
VTGLLVVASVLCVQLPFPVLTGSDVSPCYVSNDVRSTLVRKVSAYGMEGGPLFKEGGWEILYMPPCLDCLRCPSTSEVGGIFLRR